MSLYSRFPTMAMIALGGAFSSPALPQEEFIGKQMIQCAIDIPAHCSAAERGGGGIVKCLQDRRDEITPECRAAVMPTDYPDATEGLRVGVSIARLKSREGSLIVMLNDDPQTFPRTAKRTVVMPIHNETPATGFRHLKPGTYAVSVVHDLDNNGKYDPGEGFAASNSEVSPPNFARSAMNIDADISVTLSMRYP